ncbi:hypothetical protein AGMMS49928_01690 [Spirochaetia bacterium]|nr:hypothetical protein AGMMS49928_01690 [Spirochaetia bacterium]
MKNKLLILICILLVCSCNNKKTIEENTVQNSYVQSFIEINKNKTEMVYPIEYYKNKIIQFRDMFDERQYISNIVEVKDFFPGLLSFLVSWNDNLKGYIYELYTFNGNQEIVKKYLCGYGPFLNNYTDTLMEKLSGDKIGRELLSVGDFNNDGINEILSYSFYVNMGYVFTIFGYNEIENDIVHLCLVPISVNFEKPFAPVEYTENRFKILEIVDSENMDLAWNEYIWDDYSIKYKLKK